MLVHYRFLFVRWLFIFTRYCLLSPPLTDIDRLGFFAKLTPMFYELQKGIVLDLGDPHGQVFVSLIILLWLLDGPERALHCRCMKPQKAVVPCCYCTQLRENFGTESFEDSVLTRRTQEDTIRALNHILTLPTDAAQYVSFVCLILDLYRVFFSSNFYFV
jgi:hypothetical protein